MGKKKITMTIDDDVFYKFKVICKANGMKISSKVEVMMLDFIREVLEEDEDE